jgi:DNA modification methylase
MHSPAQQAALEGVLGEVGWVQDVVVNRTTGHLIDGHLRVAAAKKRNEATVPVVYVELTPAEEDLVLATFDPIGSMATCNEEALSKLLGTAQANTDAVMKLLRKLAVDEGIGSALHGGKTDADELPEVKGPVVTKLGDIWKLGPHRLCCGDATAEKDVTRLLAGAAPFLLLTDPPYGVELDMEWRDRAGMNKLGPAEKSYMRGEDHRATSISGDTRADWSEAYALVESLTVAYVWHASAFAIEVGTGLRKIGFELKQQIIWRKPQFAMSRQHYHWQHEPCWYARRPGSPKFIGTHDQPTVWDAASPKMIMSGKGETKVDHPCQKPAVLYTRPIENHLEIGGLVYDPFMGSGTAIIAAESTDRVAYGMELDPKFCDLIVERWQDFTGKKATRGRR